MTIDLPGVAAIIIAIGTPLSIAVTQYNTRKAINDARAEAKATAAAAAQERATAAAEAKAEADAHLKILNEQTGTLARVEGNTDGGLTKITAVAEKLGIQKDALAVEVERLQKDATAPTPAGPPTVEQPVGMVDGHAKAFDPAAAAAAKPPGTPL